MAGITTLSEIYSQKGDAFIKELLNEHVIISRDMGGSFFGAQLDDASGKLRYYKKGGEITAIDRLLMKFYDKPISQLESLTSETRAKLPPNYFFGMEYAPSNSDDATPGGCLTLSYIRISEPLTESEGPALSDKFVHEKQQLDEWAEALGVNKPPIIFSGKLDGDQKSSILEFVYGGRTANLKRFKTYSFSKYISELLNSDGADIHDGVIFRFYSPDSRESGATLAKIIDPVMEDIMRNAEPKAKSAPDDYMYIIIIDLMNFIETYSLMELKSVIKSGATFEDNYIDLMNKIYCDFMGKFAQKYMDIRISVPEFMRRVEFDMNEEAVRSHDALGFILMNDTFKEIYKILVNFFRKKKNKAYGIFSSSVVLQFNSLVDKLKKIVIGNGITESYTPSFFQYIGNISEEFNYLNDTGIKQRYNAYRKQRRVNMIVDSFQPVTSDYVSAAKVMHGKNRLKTVLVVIKPKPGSDAPLFSENTIYRLLSMVVSEYPELFAGIVTVDDASIAGILDAMQTSYRPVLWGTSKNRMHDYLLQMDFAKSRRLHYNLDPAFKLVELAIHNNRERVRDAIFNEKFAIYKQLTPNSIHSEFFNLKLAVADTNK